MLSLRTINQNWNHNQPIAPSRSSICQSQKARIGQANAGFESIRLKAMQSNSPDITVKKMKKIAHHRAFMSSRTLQLIFVWSTANIPAIRTKARLLLPRTRRILWQFRVGLLFYSILKSSAGNLPGSQILLHHNCCSHHRVNSAMIGKRPDSIKRHTLAPTRRNIPGIPRAGVACCCVRDPIGVLPSDCSTFRNRQR